MKLEEATILALNGKLTENANNDYDNAIKLLGIIFDMNSSNEDRNNAKNELDKLIQNVAGSSYAEPKFKRTIILDKNTYNLMNSDKFRLVGEYRDFGIYQGVTPSGYYTSQYYLITNNDITVVSGSYNKLDKADMKDLIDNYSSTGKFNAKAVNENGIYFIRKSGNEI